MGLSMTFPYPCSYLFSALPCNSSLLLGCSFPHKHASVTHIVYSFPHSSSQMTVPCLLSRPAYICTSMNFSLDHAYEKYTYESVLFCLL